LSLSNVLDDMVEEYESPVPNLDKPTFISTTSDERGIICKLRRVRRTPVYCTGTVRIAYLSMTQKVTILGVLALRTVHNSLHQPNQRSPLLLHPHSFKYL